MLAGGSAATPKRAAGARRSRRLNVAMAQRGRSPQRLYQVFTTVGRLWLPADPHRHGPADSAETIKEFKRITREALA